MKLNLHNWHGRDEGELLATFGDARLVKYLDGKIELCGGADADRAAAREWCSLFLHEAVVACAPSRPRPTLVAAPAFAS